ncbi:helix-turn-helix domain-containing protein [Planctomycetota bacterium]
MGRPFDNRLLSVAEVAKRCGVCTKGIYKLIREDRAPAFRIGRKLMIDWTSWSEWMRRNKREPRRPASVSLPEEAQAQ